MFILSFMLPVLSVDERYFLNDVWNGPSLVNSVHFPVSTPLWQVSSAVRPVSARRREECPRGSRRQKRSQLLDNGRLCCSTQLSDADGSFSERVKRSPPCIETCIIWHLDSLQESVVGGVALRGGIQYLGALTAPLSVTLQTITKTYENMR